VSEEQAGQSPPTQSLSERWRQGLFVFIFILSVRVVATIATTVLSINPESQRDAVVFASTAEAIAEGILQGQLLAPGPSQTYDLWGAFLAPFWLIPGPSIFYARLGNALLGTIAIFNIYLIARHYHSPRAGVIAIVPISIYPSFVAIHSTVLREVIVLFAITTAARYLLIPSETRSRYVTTGATGVLLFVAYIHRPDNAIIYATTIAAGMVVYAFQKRYILKRHVVAVLTLSPIGLIAATPYIQSGIEFLAKTRRRRASGRTVYLADVIPQTVPELLAFSWIGALYFLYAPFPWMIETIPDLLVSIEGLISIGFTIAALWGVRVFWQKNAPATVALLVGFVIAVVLYGVGTVNYGTGMRHRQMFLWVIFLFGGIGIAEHVRFVWPTGRGQREAAYGTHEPDSADD
jgi:hypothetical protein